MGRDVSGIIIKGEISRRRIVSCIARRFSKWVTSLLVLLPLFRRSRRWRSLRRRFPLLMLFGPVFSRIRMLRTLPLRRRIIVVGTPSLLLMTYRSRLVPLTLLTVRFSSPRMRERLVRVCRIVVVMWFTFRRKLLCWSLLVFRVLSWRLVRLPLRIFTTRISGSRIVPRLLLIRGTPIWTLFFFSVMLIRFPRGYWFSRRSFLLPLWIIVGFLLLAIGYRETVVLPTFSLRLFTKMELVPLFLTTVIGFYNFTRRLGIFMRLPFIVSFRLRWMVSPMVRLVRNRRLIIRGRTRFVSSRRIMVFTPPLRLTWRSLSFSNRSRAWRLAFIVMGSWASWMKVPCRVLIAFTFIVILLVTFLIPSWLFFRILIVGMFSLWVSIGPLRVLPLWRSLPSLFSGRSSRLFLLRRLCRLPVPPVVGRLVGGRFGLPLSLWLRQLSLKWTFLLLCTPLLLVLGSRTSPFLFLFSRVRMRRIFLFVPRVPRNRLV